MIIFRIQNLLAVRVTICHEVRRWGSSVFARRRESLLSASMFDMCVNVRHDTGRIARAKFNSIFKHSAGVVMARYANNEDGYSITDVFGVRYLAVLSTPNTKKGLLPWVCFSIPITMCVWAWAWAHIQGNSKAFFKS